MAITIRRATENDAYTLRDNIVALASEGSKVTLEPDIALDGVQSVFNQPSRGFYIVAELGNKIVGTMVILFEISDWRNGDHWWMHSIYVHPQHRKSASPGHEDVLRAMQDFVVREAKSNGAKSLQLSYNRYNEKAGKAYRRLGMLPSDSIILKVDLG